MTVSGVLVIDKPAGMTSHDVVGRVRKIYSTRKVGHGGTLDPDVTGVLVLCVGDATRLLEYVSAETKSYEGEVCFGLATDTDDATGQPVAVTDASSLIERQVLESAATLVGEQLQMVPKYSAVHIDGKRAYELARAGVEVELPSRTIVVESLDVWGFQSGTKATAHFRVLCSKGTYIRALCRDWGASVGLPAHMQSLRRTESGRFTVGEAVPLDVLASSSHPETYLLPPLTALRGFTSIELSAEMARRFVNGQKISLANLTARGFNTSLVDVQSGDVVSVLTETQELVGVAEVLIREVDKVVIKPKKVLWKREP